ncbi:hypothetical protein H4W33_006456 [Kibdelosporangium phytohabitans]|nr:hypothetical protein [Kibdelosporangium phytohabitans]
MARENTGDAVCAVQGVTGLGTHSGVPACHICGAVRKPTRERGQRPGEDP